MALSPHLVQRWSFQYYGREWHAGFKIIRERLAELYHRYSCKTRKTIIKRIERLRRQRAQEPNENVSKEIEATSKDTVDLHTSSSLSSTSSSTSLIHMKGYTATTYPWQQVHEDDEHPTTLHYSFLLLAKMLNITGQYIPAFGLSLRLGLAPSRLFVVFSYLSLVGYFILSIFLAKFALEPFIEMFIGKMNKNLKQMCYATTLFAQTGYFLYGLTNTGYVLYQRQFLQNFIYHRCSSITLARSYQRRQIAYLFLAFNAFSFLSEPLFGMLGLMSDLKQPAYWPSLTPNAFNVAKLFTIIGCGLGVTVIGSGGVIIPLMTCYLIVSATKHLSNLVRKQTARYNQIAIWSQADHNKDLEMLLNARTRKIMTDYACETLTMDWPNMIEVTDHQYELNESHESASCPSLATLSIGASGSRGGTGGTGSGASSGGDQLDRDGVNQRRRSQSRGSKSSGSAISFGTQHVNGLVGSPHYNQLLLYSNQASSKLSSSKASCLLFLYKNLIKNMSELKCIILDYERKFGSFHHIATLLACLIVSFWVTSALTEVRQSSVANAEAAAAAAAAAAGGRTLTSNQNGPDKKQKSAFTLRIMGSTITFILSNIFVFLKCDCLSDRIIKIKSQLFKMNIDLACTLINAQRRLHQQNSTAPSIITMAQQPMPRIRIDDDPLETGLVAYSPPMSGKYSKLQANWTSSIYEVDHLMGSAQWQPEQYVNQCPELDQIWSLYDQVERISSKVNFKFTSDTYYSKRCMLLVFGRSVSLILFFIQIIDMYSG